MFQNVINGALMGKTRILVTHALHFLPAVDHILVMDNGRIAESGAYNDLIEAGGAFSQLIKQFGAQEKEETSDEQTIEQTMAFDKTKGRQVAHMQVEERNTGAVSGSGQ